jgi:hypothetical protein
MRYFDYTSIANSAGIPAGKLKKLVELFTGEEPNDPMMAELHIMRACMAIKDGHLTIDQALAEAHKLAA